MISFVHPSRNLIKAQALVEFGDTLKQMADVKYALDDNVKQNFLEPLHQLQMKDLKEVMVSPRAATYQELFLNKVFFPLLDSITVKNYKVED